jgi:hypothetical protein
MMIKHMINGLIKHPLKITQTIAISSKLIGTMEMVKVMVMVN